MGQVCLRRLQNAVGMGVIMHSDFSGAQCPEVCMRFIGNELEARGHLQKGRSPCDFLIGWRSCDNNKMCQHIAEVSGLSEHVFADVRDRLPQTLEKRVQQLTPAAGASKEERARAHKAIRNVLCEESAQFTRDLRSPCLAHPGMDCPIAWSDPEDMPPSRRPLTLACAGPVCLPWCSNGTRQGCVIRKWGHHIGLSSECKIRRRPAILCF